MGSSFFFFLASGGVGVWDGEQWPNCWAATRLSPEDFLLNPGPPNTIWHATSGGEETRIKKKYSGNGATRNIPPCLVKAELLFLISLRWQFAAVGGREREQTDGLRASYYTHTHNFSEHIIIKSTIGLTHGSSSITSPAQMLLHHKSVIKTRLFVAAPLVTWLGLTFPIKYPPPQPTVAFSSTAN